MYEFWTEKSEEIDFDFVFDFLHTGKGVGGWIEFDTWSA